MRFWKNTERLLLIVGVLLIVAYVAAHIHRTILFRAELRRFQDSQSRQPGGIATNFSPAAEAHSDFGTWSEKRIQAYEHSLGEHIDPPLAVLRISRVHLEVPVLEGTDDLILNRGVGHILGTVRPGEDGNIGIAGHRDGFFRVLKDVRPRDTVELSTSSRTDTYIVDQIVIVHPDDASVLQPRSISSLTLVTCYPFYFVGSAPERYIVQASMADHDHLNLQAKSERGHTATAGHR
jgi:sortase A